MNNYTMNSGWLGAGVVDLSRIGGLASAMARPRHGKVVVFGDPTATPRSGVQQLA